MNCLQIFTKAPIPGQVKTRLQPVLSPQECAQLHKWLLLHTLQVASKSGQDNIQLWCYPTTQHDFITEMQQRFRLELRAQQGRNLGERMLNALNRGLKDNNAVILIGSDCPFFSVGYINEALALLESDLDMVIGPAKDGGFVLVAANKTMPKELFEGIAWGKNSVLKETLKRAKDNKIRYETLQPLQDIDRPEDLECINYIV
jgi:rSAM/selenodomain-associated transferase 1